MRGRVRTQEDDSQRELTVTTQIHITDPRGFQQSAPNISAGGLDWPGRPGWTDNCGINILDFTYRLIG